jgi:hypothetical protein
MSTAHTECDQFPEGSRQWAICNGVADLPLKKINGYRSIWGMEPLDASEVACVPPIPPRVVAAESPKRSRPAKARVRAKKPINVVVPRPSGKGCASCGGAKRTAQAVEKPNG